MWQYIKGFCVVTIEGLNLEKFINNLAKNKIYIFNIKRISETKIEAYVYKDDVKELISIYRKSNYNLKIKKSVGLPFFMKRVYKRKTLLFGGVLSLLILLFLTTFITNVYIDCPEGIDKKELRREIYECGLKPGTNKYIINKKDIRDSILYKFNSVAYISINIQGTSAFVDIVKKAEEPKENSKINCNIIAKKDGIIEKVIPRSGESLIKKGDIVKTGDVLIAGGNLIAKGEVWAKTFYEITEKVEYTNKSKYRTGKNKKIFKIKLYNKEFITNKDIHYKEYDVKTKDFKIKYKNFEFPIQVQVDTFYEVNIKKNDKDLNAIKNTLKSKALKKMDYLLPVQARIIDKNENYNVEKNILKFTVIIQTLENIGKYEQVEGGTYTDDKLQDTYRE